MKAVEFLSPARTVGLIVTNDPERVMGMKVVEFLSPARTVGLIVTN